MSLKMKNKVPEVYIETETKYLQYILEHYIHVECNVHMQHEQGNVLDGKNCKGTMGIDTKRMKMLYKGIYHLIITYAVVKWADNVNVYHET